MRSQDVNLKIYQGALQESLDKALSEAAHTRQEVKAKEDLIQAKERAVEEENAKTKEAET